MISTKIINFFDTHSFLISPVISAYRICKGKSCEVYVQHCNTNANIKHKYQQIVISYAAILLVPLEFCSI